tara:strand:- start:778 stop:1095 length:318 start_codon:yes stop_codon:yes gene_type:complete
MAEPKTISVNIYGQDYMLKSTGDEKYIHKIAKIVQERMKEVESTGLDANSQQLKIAVLAAMNIADELLQSEDKKNRLITRIESKGNSFIEYIDERIKEIESTKEN